MKKRRAKGNGYLITNPNGSLTLITSLKDPLTGKTKKIQVSGPTEAACIKRMKKKLSENRTKLFCVDASLTVSQLCRNYLEKQFRENLIKRTSRDRNDVTIRNQIENSPLGHMQIHSVTSKDIDTFFSALISESGLSVSSMEKVKFILNAAFKWAVSVKEMPFNPIDGIRTILDSKFSKLKKKGADDVDVRVLTNDEESSFLNIAREENKNGHYKYPGGLHGRFLLATGLRVGEYISLRWKDYDNETHILRIDKSRHPVKANEDENVETSYVSLEDGTKNSKARNIELRDDAVSILDEIYDLTPWKGPEDYIALTKTGKNYTATEMEHIVGTVYKNAGISNNVSGLHIFRRTLATKLFNEGYTVKEVAAYLGDEEATVSRYYIAARETREVNGKRVAVVSLKRNKKK